MNDQSTENLGWLCRPLGSVPAVPKLSSEVEPGIFLRRRRCTAQPRVAAAHPGDERPKSREIYAESVPPYGGTLSG